MTYKEAARGQPPTSQGEESEENHLGDTFILDFQALEL